MLQEFKKKFLVIIFNTYTNQTHAKKSMNIQYIKLLLQQVYPTKYRVHTKKYIH